MYSILASTFVGVILAKAKAAPTMLIPFTEANKLRGVQPDASKECSQRLTALAHHCQQLNFLWRQLRKLLVGAYAKNADLVDALVDTLLLKFVVAFRFPRCHCQWRGTGRSLHA